MSKLSILVGTMTGTANIVADEIAEAIQDANMEYEIVLMDDLKADVFDPANIYMICTSTYGQGDIPDNAQNFFADLETEKPDLSQIRFGVIALGDTTYAETYCFGGQKFSALLEKLGAKRTGEILECDASGEELPEDLAKEWTIEWLKNFEATIAA